MDYQKYLRTSQIKRVVKRFNDEELWYDLFKSPVTRFKPNLRFKPDDKIHYKWEKSLAKAIQMWRMGSLFKSFWRVYYLKKALAEKLLRLKPHLRRRRTIQKENIDNGNNTLLNKTIIFTIVKLSIHVCRFHKLTLILSTHFTGLQPCHCIFVCICDFALIREGFM